jgi:hypothetical protein
MYRLTLTLTPQGQKFLAKDFANLESEEENIMILLEDGSAVVLLDELDDEVFGIPIEEVV